MTNETKASGMMEASVNGMLFQAAGFWGMEDSYALTVRALTSSSAQQPMMIALRIPLTFTGPSHPIEPVENQKVSASIGFGGSGANDAYSGEIADLVWDQANGNISGTFDFDAIGAQVRGGRFDIAYK